MSTIQHDQVTANRRGRATSTVVEEQFLREMHRRWKRVRGLVRRTVGYENDAFGLSANAEERESFDFPTDSGKIEQFTSWLTQALRDEVLDPLDRGEVADGQHWTAAYIRAAVVRGVNQSTGLLFQQGVSLENIPDDQIPTRPIFEQTLRDLYTRTYENLETVTEEAAPQVRDTVTRGFAQGWNPRKMAREITAEVRDIQHMRAETLARTETINAHTESTLRNYERAGVDVVSHGEWQATQDDDTCAFCRRLSGAELTIDEMRSGTVEWRGQIYRLAPPSHPNGRCVILPSVGGEPPTSPLSERVPGTVLSGA
ncbi:phage minor head protein [Halovenus marina]|uniref:phage minor head protein n=1 Tax=Halovenus marina TaxID=3396621 RepID=UPI003F57B0A4